MQQPDQHWTRWYSLARWKRLRKQQLEKQPWCAIHKLDGVIVPAGVVDHIEKHHGDPYKFWHGRLQSVCRACHEGRKKFYESRGYDRKIGADGWPLDERHPANLPRDQFRDFGFGIPKHLRPSAIPVTLVCGPPAAGKTTWVNARRKPGDTVISLDQCKVVTGGREWDTDRRVVRRALAYRDAMLRSLATATTGRAFVVIGGPITAEREAWAEALGVEPGNVVILDTAQDTCIARLADPARAHAREALTAGVIRWHFLHQQPDRIVPPHGAMTPCAAALIA